MSNITCIVCGKRLTGGTDTFGEIALPMCQICWLELTDWEFLAREDRRERQRLRSYVDDQGAFVVHMEQTA